ncbi:glycine zipper 2TM domain-containing protein [Rhodanobacter sp. DHB23]|uniref:glycine zipper 2TM domain-containing protein n=1 Tax=Rhodanobacter sp. DHB23 TaxID=2775923 RepID=UPI00178314D2|nr:glycine zipper 2TM domain-containing protein [Rhodanobacter sp. DHB23]MBD8872994.1 glycine zipper 2TM domain-containing protein [Rhodanobacter sp. DHB23]
MLKFPVAALMLALAATGAQAQDANYPPQPPPPPPGAQYGPPQDDSAHFGWADVLRVDPVYGVTQAAPHQECYNQQVVQQNPGNTAAGTILGAVVGGVLGSTIGKGDGRRAATVAGAVAGGAVGNSVASKGSSYETTQTNCTMVGGREQRQIVGYDVEYRYRGEVYESRLGYDPGERLRVRVSVTPAE